MNFPKQWNVWTTFCVLIDIANLMAVADLRILEHRQTFLNHFRDKGSVYAREIF